MEGHQVPNAPALPGRCSAQPCSRAGSAPRSCQGLLGRELEKSTLIALTRQLNDSSSSRKFLIF